MSEAMQEPYEQEGPVEIPAALERGCLSSWYIRSLLAIIVILAILTVIGYVGYSEAKSNYSQALTINPYPGMRQIRNDEVGPGMRYQEYQIEFASASDLTGAKLAEIEAHYRRQMDKCNNFYDTTSGVEVLQAIVCVKEHTHNLLGFTQFARVRIVPHRGETTAWVGVVVGVDYQWES